MMRLTTIVAATFALAGCASFSPDGGMNAVSGLTKERTGVAAMWPRSESDAEAARQRVAELLKQALTADAAVEVAMLNNKGLQASFGDLGVAEADLVRAGRLANPSFGFTRLGGGGATEIDRSVLFNVLGLLTMPVARQVGQQRFEQAQLHAAFDAVGIAGEARRAFYRAVAAEDLVKYQDQVRQAAEASNVLAQRMVAAGNFNKLAQMRQQAFYAEATIQWAEARQQAVSAREQLVRLLGLSGEQLSFRLPERMPDLPKDLIEAKDAEQTAVDQRLDVRMARRSTEATARQLGLTNATRFINVLDVGYTNKSSPGDPPMSGYEIQLELPIFDFGSTRVARAEATYRQSLDRTAAVAINARSEVRESYSAYRTAYDLAKHYRDEVVPLRQRISDENQLRYNGMLISIFELLADAQEQVRSVSAYVRALRDFWVADSVLQTTLSGRSAGAFTAMGRSAGVVSAITPVAADASEQAAGH